jgi:hypothetical protein
MIDFSGRIAAPHSYEGLYGTSETRELHLVLEALHFNISIPRDASSESTDTKTDTN